MLISKDIPSGFSGGPVQWIKECVFTRLRMAIDFDIKKKYSKIALVGECEDRLTQGVEHDLIQIYALLDHDEDNFKLVELIKGSPTPIIQSQLVRFEPSNLDTLQVYTDVSMFGKRIRFESDSKLSLYFVLGVKN